MTDQETIGVYNRQVERYLKMVPCGLQSVGLTH